MHDPPTDLTIRDVVADDAMAIEQLRAHVYQTDPRTFSAPVEPPTTRSVEFLSGVLASYADRTDGLILGAFEPHDSSVRTFAERDRELVGMVGCERMAAPYERHRARVWGLYIRQDHRRCGVATALLQRALRFVQRLDGIERIELETTSASVAAIGLYETLGFTTLLVDSTAMKTPEGYLGGVRMTLDVSRRR